ncbi:tripartite tricarboxylate transporter substrate binding protein [Achromobacter sp. GG226]|uniref:Bug family tripartite tricarboxylate transporter substrate binding protein n=1 Tax=Verticiella alkaliphila TaxID=2779529 RepID=UPI001C0D397C|nr:tripartite tricarboxylate transporter substrate binding protein [Verticiella sp. GG226]MBU4610877.1 tripartite tricarboxylate transporter substrate binding protein [Verticiella sp. GG226]
MQASSRRGAGRRTFLAVAIAATCAAALPTAQAAAADWPNKPVRLVVNFPPGGAADVMARVIAQPISEAIGQPVVVENRAGANGNIGGESVARADGDGYTFLFSSGGVASVNPHLYPNMSFDPNKDLQPVAAAARILVFLVANPGLPAQDIKSFIAYAKANPGKLSYGSAGNGSSPHLAGEMFNAAAGTESVHVPYRGAAPAMVDLLAGQVNYMFDPGIGLQHVREGKLKLLAVGSPKRSGLFPDTPTLDEAGLKGFNADSWFGFYAPAGVDAAIVQRMNAEVNKALAVPNVKQRIIDLGGEPAPMSPQDFAARAKEDSERFSALIRERGIKAN